LVVPNARFPLVVVFDSFLVTLAQLSQAHGLLLLLVRAQVVQRISIFFIPRSATAASAIVTETFPRPNQAAFRSSSFYFPQEIPKRKWLETVEGGGPPLFFHPFKTLFTNTSTDSGPVPRSSFLPDPFFFLTKHVTKEGPNADRLFSALPPRPPPE